MSEKLEKLIRTHRGEFDEFEPPADLWKRIEKQLDEKKSVKPLKDRVIRLSFILKIAAMLLVVLWAGLFIITRNQKTGVDISAINPGMAKMQVQYASMIETRREEIKQVEKQDPYLYNEFAAEIRKMDVNYQKLKNELPNSPNQEETVKAMIRNLQIQLSVLNQQLTIIEQINQIKKGQSNGNQII